MVNFENLDKYIFPGVGKYGIPQIHGMVVYPTVAWSDVGSYEWCFDGEPTNSVVAVSSVGVQRDTGARRLFLRGYEEMMARLAPTQVLFYGDPPKECGGNILRIAPHYEEIRRRCKKQ